MTRILVVGEDQLCCALGARLVQSFMPRWTLSQEPINTRGVTRFRDSLPRYSEQARFVQPVLCIADTDGQCAVGLLRDWVPEAAAGRLLVRLAVTEAESWALADAEEFSSALAVPLNKIPRDPEGVVDAKGAVLQLARRSKNRRIRDEVVSATDPGKPGTGYNLHLCEFVMTRWRPTVAAGSSPSLQRAAARLAALAASGD
jgi:hypothetical protein